MIPPVDPAAGFWTEAFSTAAVWTGGFLVLIVSSLIVSWILAAFPAKTPWAITTRRALGNSIRKSQPVLILVWSLAAALGLWQIAMTHQQIWTAMDRTTKQTTVIQVTGLQYAWAFRMPGPDGLFGDIDPKLLSKDNPFGLATSDPKGLDDEIQIGFLETTAGETLTFEIRTLDVIHSFYLPEFRSQVNAMPFNRVYLSVGPTQPGQYTIQCNQFCGLGHYRMQANWIVHPNPHNAENHLSSE